MDPDWGGWQVRAHDPVRNYTEPISPRRFVDRRSRTTGGIIDGRIYVVGGIRYDRAPIGEERDPPVIVAEVDVYDVATDTWTTAAPMHTPRAGAESAVVDGKLYVMGGYNGDLPSQDLELVETMEVYDPATDTWMEEPGMPTPRYGHGVAAVDGRLYALGGLDTLLRDPVTTPVATVEVFSSECRPGRGKARGWRKIRGGFPRRKW